VPPGMRPTSESKFYKAELKVQAIARRRANNQLMRVPWSEFRRVYEEYPRWQALVLWVQVIVATQDGIPSWVVADLRKRCPGFAEHQAVSNEPQLVALHLMEWVHNQAFGNAKRQGWLDALVFYGIRHPYSESAWAYWEHCEGKWRRRPSSTFPNFEKWVRLARNYSPPRQMSLADFAGLVERYVEWKVFSCWVEPLTIAKIELPKDILTEFERKCPGYLEMAKSDSIQHPNKKASTGSMRSLMKWVEDRFFSDERKEGRLDIIRRHACMHPLYARTLRYSEQWNNSWSQNPTDEYPSFILWCRRAENYIEQ